jgi:hypothetical protein
MMTPQEIEAFIDRITYKPGWEVAYVWSPHPPGSFVLTVYTSVNLPDSRNPGKTVPFTNGIAISPPDFLSEQRLLLHIRSMFLAAEMHELDEWFKLDGVPAHDPHGASVEQQLYGPPLSAHPFREEHWDPHPAL